MCHNRTLGSGLRLLAGVLASVILVAAEVHAASAQGAPAAVPAQPGGAAAEKPTERYFVDFRARLAQVYGHSFVVHGRLTGSDKITADQVAGLHPATNSAIPYFLGHVVPVFAETGASYGDTEKKYVSASYRVILNKAEYLRVAAFIKKLQASSPVWQAEIYNCNAFVADIARFMGLKVPSHLLMPKDFITGIKQLNGGARRTAATEPAPAVH